MNKIRKYLPNIFWLGIFAAIFWYFAFIHPLYVYDMDDWTYITPVRKAIPIWGNWNPTKVLPETWMPLSAELGYRLLYPFSGDFIGSVAIGFALAVSLSYTVYFWLFTNLIRGTGFRIQEGMAVGAFMILLHFLPYMTSLDGNSFMYLASNVTTTFNYTIPALLNAGLVLYFSKQVNRKAFQLKEILHRPIWKHGIWILMVYLAINSNLFQSIIFMAFVSGTLLVEFLERFGERESTVMRYLITFVKENVLWFCMIVLWLMSLYMESQGGRAAGMQYRGNYLESVGKGFVTWWKTLTGLNSFFLAAAILTIGAAFFFCLRNRKRGENKDKEYFHMVMVYTVSFSLTSLYLILLCARTSLGYLQGSSVFSAVLFYVLLLMGISIVYVIQNIRAVTSLIPLAVYVLLFATVINVRSYREINYGNCDAKVVKQIGNDIVKTVVAARGGNETVEVHVPLYSSENNWPLAPGLSERIAKALYSYGMTDDMMNVILIPDEALNDLYHIK